MLGWLCAPKVKIPTFLKADAILPDYQLPAFHCSIIHSWIYCKYKYVVKYNNVLEYNKYACLLNITYTSYTHRMTFTLVVMITIIIVIINIHRHHQHSSSSSTFIVIINIHRHHQHSSSSSPFIVIINIHRHHQHSSSSSSLSSSKCTYNESHDPCYAASKSLLTCLPVLSPHSLR